MINQIIDRTLDFLEYYVCGVLFFAMAAIILIQIILRVTGLPLSWTEETARYLFVWIIYLAASRAVRQSKHLQVDLLSIILRGKAHTVLTVFVNLTSLLFFLLLVRYGSHVMVKMYAHPQYSAAMKYNIGSIMMTVRTLQNIAENLSALKMSDSKVKTGEEADKT